MCAQVNTFLGFKKNERGERDITGDHASVSNEEVKFFMEFVNLSAKRRLMTPSKPRISTCTLEVCYVAFSVREIEFSFASCKYYAHLSLCHDPFP